MTGRCEQSGGGDDPVEVRAISIAEAFQEAWPAAIDDFLPPAGEVRARALAKLCHIDLELRWRAGREGRAADYLRRYPDVWAANRGAALNLIAAEYELRREYLRLEAFCRDYDDGRSGLLGHLEARFSEPASPPRYRNRRYHRSGGLGDVFLAEDEQLGRSVALKQLQDRHRHYSRSREQFLFEAKVTGLLEHPGIVPVYSLERGDDGLAYYTMRFIVGESLQEAIARYHGMNSGETDPGARNLALRGLLGRFVSVCRTVSYAHSRGVLHCDLKPANIMLGPFGETLVVDWGLAKPFAHRDDDLSPRLDLPQARPDAPWAGLSGGTPGYASPEQTRGRTDLVGPASDVYSLGATLYSILTGRTPVAQPDARTSPDGHDVEPVVPPRQAETTVPPALEAVCRKAMAHRPGDRYESALELAGDLERWLAGEPVSAYREPLAVRARRWARRHPALVGATTASALVAALLLGSTWAVLRRREADRQGALAARVQAALDAANRHAGAARAAGDPTAWAEALAAAAHAADHAALSSDPVLRLRARTTRDALAHERDVAHRSAKLLVDLDAARLRGAGVRSEHFDTAGKCAAYRAAFRDCGVDVATISTAEALARLKPIGHAEELASALDDWAFFGDRATRTALQALARALDPDTERSALRDAIAHRELAVLRRLAEEIDPARQPPATLTLLAQALAETGAPESAAALLERSQHHQPGQFWINHDLGVTLGTIAPPRHNDAVRYLTAALALRPNSPGVLLSLGNALSDKGDADGAIAAYRRAAELHPGYAMAHYNLGNALVRSGNLDGAVAAYHRALEAQPGYVMAHVSLGNALVRRGDADGAVAAYRRALEFRPEDAEILAVLGGVLSGKGDADGAIAAYRRALELRPDFAEAHLNLGNDLARREDTDGAIAAYRRALELRPDFAEAHHGMGVALFNSGDAGGAIAALRRAVELRPDFAEAHVKLGNALARRGDTDGAIAALRRALELRPDLAEAHFKLGNALARKGDADGAIAALRRALELRPGYAEAHVNLGVALSGKGDADGAIAAYRRALELRPDLAEAHLNLGNDLARRGDAGGAIAAYRRALELRPEDALAHYNLGHVLRMQNRLAEALAELERGHELGSKRPGWPYPSARWVEEVRRLVALEARLPAVLRNESVPSGDTERVMFADLAYKKGLHVASARLWTDAFATSPTLAEDLESGHRYNAACAAALAGSGKGKDDPRPDDAARADLRNKALAWLRADLAARAKLLGSAPPEARAAIARTLRHWQTDPDLAGLRDPDELARLPKDEQKECRALWADVSDLLARTNNETDK